MDVLSSRAEFAGPRKRARFVFACRIPALVVVELTPSTRAVPMRERCTERAVSRGRRSASARPRTTRRESREVADASRRHRRVGVADALFMPHRKNIQLTAIFSPAAASDEPPAPIRPRAVLIAARRAPIGAACAGAEGAPWRRRRPRLAVFTADGRLTFGGGQWGARRRRGATCGAPGAPQWLVSRRDGTGRAVRARDRQSLRDTSAGYGHAGGCGRRYDAAGDARAGGVQRDAYDP